MAHPASRSRPVASAGDPAGPLVEAVRAIAARGWCPATSGNFSVVAGRDPLRLLLTRSGFDKARIGPDDLVEVDGTGRAVGAGTPSAEAALHGMLAEHAGAGAVLHTHTVWSTLLGLRHRATGGLALRGFEMLKAFDGIATHRAVLWVPVVDNSQAIDALAREIRPRIVAAGPPWGLLIAGHGLYAWGADLDAARRHLEAFEFLFEIIGRQSDSDRSSDGE